MTDLHHSEQGVGDPPALLIHGTGAAVWGELPPLLAQRRRTIVYDRRGFSDSPGPTLKVGTGEDLEPQLLSGIDVRGIWLLGDRSQPAFAKAAKRRAGLLRRVEVRPVTGAGHGIQLDRADAVADAVEELAA